MYTPIDVQYRIDNHDRLAFVDDGWTEVARREAVPELEKPQVIGRSLWGYLSDATTVQLYQQILARVRTGRSAKFAVRCDGPRVRRVIELSIAASEQEVDHVNFATRTIQCVEREWMPLLDRAVARSAALVRSCSWCNRIEVRNGDWMEVEDATHELKLFERAHLPKLTHGMCASCELTMTIKLEAFKHDRAD